MEASRVERLDELGMIWEPDNDLWEVGFQHLEEYVAETSNALVPHAYKSPDGYALGHWVAKQRLKKISLTAGRRELLRNTKGWAWSATEARWETGFLHLETYIARHGQMPGATDKIDGYNVGSWAVVQRKRYREENLPDELIRRLEGLGSVWEWAPKSGPR